MTPPDADLLLESFSCGEPLLPPRTAYVNVVKRCNAGCGYCADWTAPRDPRLDPPLEQLAYLFGELRRLGVGDLVVSGGEPFLRRDLPDVLEAALECGFEIRVISNGSLITRDHVRALVGLGITKVGISIDSLVPDRLMAIRGLKAARVRRTIEILAGDERTRPRVALYVTITRANLDDLIPLADYARRLGITVQYQPVHFAGTGLDEHILTHLWPAEPDLARLDGIIAELVRGAQDGTLPINSRPDFLQQIPRFFRDRTFHPERCTVAYTDVVIDQDLNLRPCWSMPAVASLAQPGFDLVRIWRAPEMRAVREEIKQDRCPGCLFSCHMNKPHISLNKARS